LFSWLANFVRAQESMVKEVVKVDSRTLSGAIQFQLTLMVRIKNGPRNDPLSHIVHASRLLAFRRPNRFCIGILYLCCIARRQSLLSINIKDILRACQTDEPRLYLVQRVHSQKLRCLCERCRKRLGPSFLLPHLSHASIIDRSNVEMSRAVRACAQQNHKHDQSSKRHRNDSRLNPLSLQPGFTFLFY
jgi:hypothetical protein